MADGDDTADTEYLGGGAGLALVYDPGSEATILWATDDGSSWRPVKAFPSR